MSKSRFPRDGEVYKRPITGTGKETHGYSRLLVVLRTDDLKRSVECRMQSTDHDVAADYTTSFLLLFYFRLFV